MANVLVDSVMHAFLAFIFGLYFNNLGNSNINPNLAEKNTWFQKQSGIILSILFSKSLNEA